MTSNILIIDNSYRSTKILELIIKNHTNDLPIINTNKDQIIELLQTKEFRYIIIDHSLKFSDDIINMILEENPNQKVILLSDSINCPIDCDSCVNMFKFVRLIKPIDIKQVLFHLNQEENFLCPNKGIFRSINTLDKLYNFLNVQENLYFCKKELCEEKIIIKANKNSNINYNEFEKIKENIHKDYFDIKINSFNDIEICCK